MPVATRSSSVPATRSRDKKKPSWVPQASTSYRASSLLSRAKKAQKGNESATKASQEVGRATRAQATPSSFTTRSEIRSEETEVPGPHRTRTSPATRSHRAANIVVAVKASLVGSRLSRRTSIASTHSSRKRKAQVIEEKATAASSLKRKRIAPSPVEDAQTRALRERESALSERDDAVRKLETADRKREELENARDKLMNKVDKLNLQMKASKAQLEQAKREWKAKVKALTDERNMLAKLREAEKIDLMEVSSASRLPSADLQWVLSHLEDQYTCSLCFEVIANPYSLNNGRCGHAFCALCILKWAFAAVHRGCGYWHNALECPLCRATLPYASDTTPRNICTFPFIPDRLADAAIKSYLTILKDAADSKVMPTTSYGGASGQDGSHWQGDIDEQVLAWGEGNASRTEWERRERNGKAQMTLLFNNWSQYQAEDFIALKDRLEAV